MVKYREILNYRKEPREVIGTIVLDDGELSFAGVSDMLVEEWKEVGIQLGKRLILPDEHPELFFRWVQVTNTSYRKIGPIYDDGEEE